MNPKFKRFFIPFLIVITLLEIILIIFNSNNLQFNYRWLNSLFSYVSRVFFICILIYIIYIKSKKIKYSLLILYFAFCCLIFFIRIPFKDLPLLVHYFEARKEMNQARKTKYVRRLVYSKQIDKNLQLNVFNSKAERYKESDGNTYVVLVKNLGFGISKYWKKSPWDLYWNYETDSSEVVINGTKYLLPNPTQLNKLRISKEIEEKQSSQ